MPTSELVAAQAQVEVITGLPNGVAQAVNGFIGSDLILLVPIGGAFVVVGIIALILYWSAQPTESDGDE